MNKPKVSVLIPCYNVEKYIRQCMDSVVNQTLKEIEIICINDGSKDNTLAILKEYAEKDDRIVIIDKANSGYGDSMNQGLKKANGEYIGIVESDDFVEQNMFETLYNAAIQNNVEVVKSNFYAYVTKTDTNTKTIVIPESDEKQVICPRERQGIFWSAPCIWAAIYKREFLLENNIDFLPTPGASYQDTGFNFKVWAMTKRAYFLNEAFLHYRQDNENSSINSPGKVYCVCDEYHEIEHFAREKGVYEELKYLIPRLKFGAYYWNFERLSFPLNYRFLKVFSKEFHEYFTQKTISKELFGKRLLRRVRRIAKQPFLYFIGYYLKKIKNSILRRKK